MTNNLNDISCTAEGRSPAAAVVKTVPALPEPAKDPQLKPVQDKNTSTGPSAVTPSSLSSETPPSAPTEDTQKLNTPLPSSPAVKTSPSFNLPKPQSPVNVVTPMTQTPPPLVTLPSTQTKPAVVSVPTYVPITATTACVAPTPVSFCPQVLQTSSLSPIGEGSSTPTRGTPSGHATCSTALRQGVPQKPYTFLDEKAR